MSETVAMPWHSRESRLRVLAIKLKISTSDLALKLANKMMHCSRCKTWKSNVEFPESKRHTTSTWCLECCRLHRSGTRSRIISSLADALRHQIQRNHEFSESCSSCKAGENLLNAASRVQDSTLNETNSKPGALKEQQ